MPLAFPSHQGLILPVARRWPGYFDGLALCVGATMPDIVDGVAGLVRGHMGQWYGHSLIGVVLLCWPAGLLVTGAIAFIYRHFRGRASPGGKWRAVLSRSIGWPPPPTLVRPGPLARSLLLLWSLSVIVGALSHVLFDCCCHEQCRWLFPLGGDGRCYPAWWYHTWFRVPLPFYDAPYPFAPHTVAWCLLSVLGAVMFFRVPKPARGRC